MNLVTAHIDDLNKSDYLSSNHQVYTNYSVNSSGIVNICAFIIIAKVIFQIKVHNCALDAHIKFYYNYGFFSCFSLLAALYFPIEEAEAVSEYGYKIAEGLHRCTTKTSNWYNFLFPFAERGFSLPIEYYDSIEGRLSDSYSVISQV